MNEGITSIMIPCDIDPCDSLRIEYVSEKTEGKQDDFLCIDMVSEDSSVRTIIVDRLYAVNIRDFLIKKLG